MATIHLMTGFIGFGKTTIAKQLETKLSATRFTHDEIMVERYGRDMPYNDFHTNYQKVDEFIRNETAKQIKTGKDVILDYGFWGHNVRRQYYEWAKTLTSDVLFHAICCDLATAKERVLKRTQNDDSALVIDENAFDKLLKQYEPWSKEDPYPVVFYNASTTQYIGNIVNMVMDRPLGSKHPKHGFIYPVNYGYVPHTISGDGEELDAYVLGINTPLKDFIGRCIAVVHRTNDNDDKLVIVPDGISLSDAEIEQAIAFQEQWFKHQLLR